MVRGMGGDREVLSPHPISSRSGYLLRVSLCPAWCWVAGERMNKADRVRVLQGLAVLWGQTVYCG